jgi:hypothetical protein
LVVVAAACDSGGDAAADKPAAEAKAPAKADAKAAPDAKAEPAAEKFGGEFCAVIVPCFEKLKFVGNFSATVTVDIEPDGKVASSSFTGEAPQPVQTCIADDIKAITLSPYNGKPGRTTCTSSGQLSGGTRMVMSDSTYEVRDATVAGDDAAGSGGATGSGGTAAGSGGADTD